MLRPALVVCTFLLAAAGAAASDGVIEINQARALAGGVTPGDAPGFPVTLGQTGSYLLTSNLSVPADTSGIVVSTIPPGIVLDLGGFEIAGAGSCSGVATELTCTGGGSAGNGVTASVPVRVRNGRIRGFGATGVLLIAGRSQVEYLRVEQNAGDGINVGKGSLVSDSIAASNFANGIVVDGSVVQRSSARANRLIGMKSATATGNVFVGNVSSNNGQIGIHAGSNSVVRDNSVTFNSTDGIVVTGGSLVSDNVSSQNNQAGIAALSTSSVQRNIVRGNGGVGLYLFPESGGAAAPYRENVVVDNFFGTVTNGLDMGGNSCNGTATCP